VTTALGVTAILLLLVAVVLLVALLSKQGSGSSAVSRVREDLQGIRDESTRSARELREEVSEQTKRTADTLVKAVAELGKTQSERLEAVGSRVRELTESNADSLEKVRESLDQRIRRLQESNESKLDQMRQTVDEKLQSTLEKRLTESFKVVSENLEAVQRGLGEMRSLATGVGDLKRVLTNVKSRGTWGEVQLGALLEDVLTPDQYVKNANIDASTREAVEFAVCLPGRDSDDPNAQVLLPIDSKFPQEDYQRLLDASEAADSDAVRTASGALLRSLHGFAKDISQKYILPPKTTDFAIMFLPTEGLYSEILRQPGEVEQIQRKYRVVVAGPTTLAALLTSLRMGFRTLAIEKRSSEVWGLLAGVKTEFGKFGAVLARVRKQLETASRTIEKTEVRTRAMERKLRSVEELPAQEAETLLELGDLDVESSDFSDEESEG